MLARWALRDPLVQPDPWDRKGLLGLPVRKDLLGRRVQRETPVQPVLSDLPVRLEQRDRKEPLDLPVRKDLPAHRGQRVTLAQPVQPGQQELRARPVRRGLLAQ
jgi:hypothetical protein